jgi:hypothetical protein
LLCISHHHQSAPAAVSKSLPGTLQSTLRWRSERWRHRRHAPPRRRLPAKGRDGPRPRPVRGRGATPSPVPRVRREEERRRVPRLGRERLARRGTRRKLRYRY